MKVKQLADLADTTVRSVRYYHQQGLLPVPPTRAGVRDYGFEHLVRLARIRWLADAGVPLRQIGDMLGEGLTADEVGADLDATIAAIEMKIAGLRLQRDRLAVLRESPQKQRLSPLAPELRKLYDDLEAETVDAEVRDAIHREREIAEVMAFRGMMPPEMAQLVSEMDARLRRLGLRTFVAMVAVRRDWPGSSPAERQRLEREVDRIAQESVDLTFSLSPKAFDTITEYLGGIPRDAMRLVEAGFDSDVERLLFARTLELFEQRGVTFAAPEAGS